MAAPAAATDLTRGASTVVPARLNPGLLDAFGKPYEVRTRVTAVRFHDGARPSTAPGGLTVAPHPRWTGGHFEVTGELSGVGHSPIGFEYVYGPLDGNGADQSGNPASPRFGLRGIPFRLEYPAHWNRRLIVFRPAGDGGRGAGHYLFGSPIEEDALFRRGYAYFVTLGTTTAPPDTNPNSGSGRFWHLAPPYWRADGPPHPNSLRAARIGADWSEHVIPDSTPGHAQFIGDPDPVPTPIGSPDFPADVEMTINDDVPTYRDHVNIAKNLVERLLGARPASTGSLSWSRSGALGLAVDLGRTMQYPPAAIGVAAFDPETHRSLTARTGGDFNTPYVPGSGKLIDWFVVRSGVEFAVTPQPPDGIPDGEDMRPDPEYPIAAPLVMITGEADIRDAQMNPYLFANELADALPGSKLADKDVNHWLRLYTLRGATHQPREAWFDGASPAAWIETLRANNPDLTGDDPFSLDFIEPFFEASVSEQGFELQAIRNAERWARSGDAPPVSAVDANLVTHPTEETTSPRYPVAEDCTPDAVFGGDLGCLDALREDYVINDPNSGYGPLDPDFDLPLLREFSRGPLRFTTRQVDLPGHAAPLSVRLFTPGPVFARPFTTSELRARYRTHAGYVAAVTRAAGELVARGLYDPETGAREVFAAQRSEVLR